MTNHAYRRILNDLYEFSALKEVGPNSSPLKCRTHFVTCFQRLHYEKQNINVTFKWRNLPDTTSYDQD